MSRYRKIDPRIWNDSKFRELSDSGKLVFFMLLTHPNMTALGAMRATLSGLAEELGWLPEAFREAFREACAKGMAEHDPKACFVALPKFLKYNPPESPNVIKAWVSALDLLPECGLKTLVIARAKGFAEGMSEAFAKALPEAFAKGMPYQEQEQEQEQEEARACPKAAPSDQPTDIAKAKADRAERLAAVTEDAIETFNASPFTVAHGGRVPNVTKVNREKRRQQVARAIRVIREICTEEFGGPEITRDFWLGYWQIVNGDAFASGRQAGTGAHSNWRPDFEYLTRPDTITALYERAEAAA